MGIMMLILFAVSAAYCFAVLCLTRRLPVLLRLLICTVLLALFCPLLLIHEGGAAIAPLAYFLTFYLDDLKHDDIKSLAFEISFVWGVANCILLIVVGIFYFARKKGKHIARPLL